MEVPLKDWVRATASTETTLAAGWLSGLLTRSPLSRRLPVTLSSGIWLVKVRPLLAVAGNWARMRMVQTPGVAPTPAAMLPLNHCRPASMPETGALPVLAPAASRPTQEPPLQPVLV